MLFWYGILLLVFLGDYIMENKYLRHVYADDAKDYLNSLGYTENQEVTLEQDKLGQYMHLHGVDANGSVFDKKMGSHFPRTQKKDVIVEHCHFAGDVKADVDCHDFDAVCVEDGWTIYDVPEYVSKWWKKVAECNRSSAYLREVLFDYTDYCGRQNSGVEQFKSLRKLEVVRRLLSKMIVKLENIQNKNEKTDNVM